MPPPDDLDRLRHIVDAAREAIGFANGRSRDDLDDDRQLQLSLVKLVEIVGEAAGHLSPETQAMAPELPWPKIRAMRNRLAHGYFEIDLGIVAAAVPLPRRRITPSMNIASF